MEKAVGKYRAEFAFKLFSAPRCLQGGLRMGEGTRNKDQETGNRKQGARNNKEQDVRTKNEWGKVFWIDFNGRKTGGRPTTKYFS